MNHIEVNMGTDFGSEDFNSKLVRGLRYMISHPGVFEVNCIYGKDRTGFMIADLAAATEDYLRKNGMTDSEIRKLRKCLTTNKYLIPKGTVIKSLKLSSRKAVIKWRKQKSAD